MKPIKTAILFSSILALQACASVIDGTSEEITINTNPPGADCELVRENTPDLPPYNRSSF